MQKQVHVNIDIMTDEKKLEFAATLHKEVNHPSIEAEDIYNLMNNHKFNTKIQVEKAVKVMAYIRLRDFEQYTRADAYRKVYPDRWEKTDTNKDVASRARRLETTDMYKKLIMELQMNFYSVFAVERIHVVNESLRRAFDTDISEKYNFEYMKLFLESTRKPDEAKQYEVNMNIKTDGVSIKDVEAKLDNIAAKLDGASQDDIIEAILLPKDL